MKKAMWAIFGGALLLYVVIVIIIAVGPAIDLAQTPPGPGVVPLTPLEAEGRQVFASNGCDYCHTLQVRPLPEDKVFGRPSAPGDFAYATPEMLGSERTGPDLTNVGNRRGEIWQYMHLYDPRDVSPESIMPNFKFMFREVKTVPEGETAVPIPAAFAPKNGDKVIPTQKAKALVAYLMSLKQAPIPGYKMNGGMGGPTSAEAPATSAPAANAGGYAYDAGKGKAAFDSTCAACHQASGEGVPGAFPPLKGNAAVENADPTTQLDTILHGRHGTVIGGVKYSGVMPEFASQLSDTDIADIANYERSAWGNHGKPVTPAEVATLRAGKPLGAASSAPATSAASSAPAASAAPASASAAAGGYTFDAAKGKALFDSTCAACHQATGEGVPGAFPPLKGNAAVDNADPTLHLHTILHGAHGVTIGGVKYAGAMPEFASQLSDDDIANIANYERSSWGNHAKQVTPAEVAKIRAAGK
ncbi:MAG TPA: c-type cytochrome [Rhodanobacteraceae bacterium]